MDKTAPCIMAECGATGRPQGLKADPTFHVAADKPLPLFPQLAKGVGGLPLRPFCRHSVSLWLGLILGPLLLSRRHFSPQRTSFSWKTIAFLLFFLLCLEKTSAKLSRKLREKPGMCPRDRASCKSEPQRLCYNDYECLDHQKCCIFNCVVKCLDPDQEPCLLPLDMGNGTKNEVRWYYDSDEKLCKEFNYRGNLGNNNNFASREDCERFCEYVLKEGQCPDFPIEKREVCPNSCKSDMDCPVFKKCCETECGFSCIKAWSVKGGYCPRKPKTCPRITKPQCVLDLDCPMSEKCCSFCGLKCLNFRR